jgi:hypothetical protein
MNKIAITTFLILFSPLMTGSRAQAESTNKVIKSPTVKSPISTPSSELTIKHKPKSTSHDRSKPELNSVKNPRQDPRQQPGSNCPACGMG